MEKGIVSMYIRNNMSPLLFDNLQSRMGELSHTYEYKRKKKNICKTKDEARTSRKETHPPPPQKKRKNVKRYKRTIKKEGHKKKR